MTGYGASVGNSLGESAGAATAGSRHPAPPWKAGTDPLAQIRAD